MKLDFRLNYNTRRVFECLWRQYFYIISS